MSATYGNGFTLDFAYCKNCRFYTDRRGIHPRTLAIMTAKELLAKGLEQIHDDEWQTCPKRELVISYNRVMVENV